MKQPHILIAEDETEFLFALELSLKTAGYLVSTAKDGREALAKLLKVQRNGSPVDVILLDIQLPVLNGLEVLKTIREADLAIPVIAFSGFGDKSLLQSLMRDGRSQYMDKPFLPEEILERVGELVKKSHKLVKEK